MNKVEQGMADILGGLCIIRSAVKMLKVWNEQDLEVFERLMIEGKKKITAGEKLIGEADGRENLQGKVRDGSVGWRSSESIQEERDREGVPAV